MEETEVVKYIDICSNLYLLILNNNINTYDDFNKKVIPFYKNIWIQYFSIPYHTALYQRPQHICNNISTFNYLSIYMEANERWGQKEIEYICEVINNIT